MGRRQLGSRVALAIWAAAFVASIPRYGFPMQRDRLVLWTIPALLALAVANPRRLLRGIVVDWAPLLGILLAYDLLRGVADDLATKAHVVPQLRADEILFFGQVPTVWLQRRLWSPGDPQWWDFAAWAVYLTHFVVPLGVAAALWARDHARFRRYALMMVTLTAVAFVTYLVFPAVPPWLASQMGALEPTDRIVAEMWRHAGVERAARVFSGGNRYANDVAAVPSLHNAYPFLILLFFWGGSWRRRAVLVAYVAAMALTSVYGAEHYVSDVLAGYLYAWVAFAGLRYASARWLNRKTEAPAAAQAPGRTGHPAGPPARAPDPSRT